MAPRRHGSPVAGGELLFNCRTQTGDEQTGVVRNLGAGGLAVSLAQQPARGDELHFQLVFGDKAVSGHGRLVWASEGDGDAGMAFVQLDESAQRMIDLWLQQRGVLRRGS